MWLTLTSILRIHNKPKKIGTEAWLMLFFKIWTLETAKFLYCLKFLTSLPEISLLLLQRRSMVPFLREEM